MIEELSKVKAGLEIFGVEKRLKALESRPVGGSSRGQTVDTSTLLKIDQSTPQAITGGTPNLNLENETAPVGKANGYLSVVSDALYYFSGGNRYKLTATLDNPVAATDRYASLWFLFGNVHK